jgi:hypothetical protein
MVQVQPFNVSCLASGLTPRLSRKVWRAGNKISCIACQSNEKEPCKPPPKLPNARRLLHVSGMSVAIVSIAEVGLVTPKLKRQLKLPQPHRAAKGRHCARPTPVTSA